MSLQTVAQRLLSDLSGRKAARVIARQVFRATSFLRGRTIRLDGVRFHVPSADRFIALLLERVSRQRPFALKVLDDLLRPGMVVADVGANVGRYSLRAAQLVGPTGRVYALEPDAPNAAALRKTIADSGLRGIELLEAAAGDIDGMVELFLCEEHRGDHRTYPTGDARRAVAVRSVRLDTLLGDAPSVDLVKIDVQGAEYRVLQGMSSLLARHRRLTIHFEFWPKGLSESGTEAELPLRFLTDRGFALHWIDERRRCLTPIRPAECVERCSGNNYLDLVARRC
jgi:FkbM family methyltransferase